MAALGAGRDGHMPPAYRTVLCRYFQSGYCPAGDNCTFIHSSEDSPTPSTQQCKNFLMGSCKNGINCPFAHSTPVCSYQQQTQQTSYTQPQQHPFSGQGTATASSNDYKMGKFSQEEIDALRSMARNGGAPGVAQHHPQAYALMSPYGEVEGYGGATAAYAVAAPALYGHPPAAFATDQAVADASHAAAAAGIYQQRYLAPGAPPYAQSPYAYGAPPTYTTAPAPAYTSPLAHPKAKTKMCTFWPDRCRKGDQCPYIHGEDDPLHVGGPAARMQAVAMQASMASVPHVPAGAYFAGPTVVQKRLRPPPSVIGTKFCKFFLVGACTRGSECTFSHDQRVREREEQQKQQQLDTEPPIKCIRTSETNTDKLTFVSTGDEQMQRTDELQRDHLNDDVEEQKKRELAQDGQIKQPDQQQVVITSGGKECVEQKLEHAKEDVETIGPGAQRHDGTLNETQTKKAHPADTSSGDA